MLPGVGTLVGVWTSPGGPAYAVGLRTDAQWVVLESAPGATAWTTVRMGTERMDVVGGTVGEDVYVALPNGILRRDSGSWTPMPTDVLRIEAIAGSSTGDAFAVGTDGAIVRYRRPGR